MGDNFRQKSRFVTGGHMKNTPDTFTYSSEVSRYLVRIDLTIVALSVLDILSCDIQNNYLTDDFREKIWTRAGP